MPTHELKMDQSMEQCIQNCLDCARICMETLTYCHEQGGKHTEPGHLKLLMDCSEICQISAHFMLRGSEFHKQTCAVCADVCERCAQDCERFGDDAQMQTCAQVCRRCTESCRQMSMGKAA